MLESPKRASRISLLMLWLLAHCRLYSSLSFAASAIPRHRRIGAVGFRGSHRRPIVYAPRMSSFDADADLLLDGDMDEYCNVVDDFGCQAFESFVEDEQNPKEHFRWIRLERDADPSLEGIRDQQAVFDKIKTVKAEQAVNASCELYNRQWLQLNRASPSTVNGAAVNGLAPPNHTFTIAQFNALAEGLSCAPDATPPFKATAVESDGQSDKNPGFGGFTTSPFQEIVLDFSLRRWRLLEVLLSTYRQSEFDIIAVEEVDRYRGFFSPMLQLFGYNSFFAPKTRSPCLPFGWYSDGCALFWKADKFELVSARRHEYRLGSQIYIVAVLRHSATRQCMVVAVTHLKAQSSASNEKIRCAQVDELLSQVARCIADVAKNELTEVAAVPVLFVGDLNADAQCEFEEPCIRQRILHNKILGQLIHSAYPIDPPHPSFYTTWKIRGSKEAKRIIDYIFYTGQSLNCTAILQVPAEEELEVARLPGLRYPSDHMLIAAEFTIQ